MLLQQSEREERERNYERAKTVARRERWEFPAKARVVHHKYGSTVVPAKSKLAAIMCAAEVWGCDWGTVIDAEVWRFEKNEKKPPAPGAGNTAQVAQNSDGFARLDAPIIPRIQN